MKDIKQIGLSALSVLLIIVLIITIPFSTRLNLKSRDAELIKSYSLRNGKYFQIQFRHSVNRGIVVEEYQIHKKDKLINLERGWFENYGAGMMDTLGEGMTMTEDSNMLRIDFPENMVESVNFAAAGIANHIFTYGDKQIALYEEYPYKTINIRVEKQNYLGLMKLFIKDMFGDN